jgi:AraC-like DNA-binding protein
MHLQRSAHVKPEGDALLGEALSGLRRLAIAAGEAQRRGNSTPAAPRDRAIRGLTRVIAADATPLHLFLAACSGFRAVALPSDPSRIATAAALFTAAMEKRGQAVDPRVVQLLQEFSQRPELLPATRSIALSWQVTPTAVTATLLRALGVNLPRLRVALRCRPVIRDLVTTDEHVAQIAYGRRYEHPSQLDHDFQRLLGLSPRAFRRHAASLSPG